MSLSLNISPTKEQATEQHSPEFEAAFARASKALRERDSEATQRLISSDLKERSTASFKTAMQNK